MSKESATTVLVCEVDESFWNCDKLVVLSNHAHLCPANVGEVIVLIRWAEIGRCTKGLTFPSSVFHSTNNKPCKAVPLPA